MMKRLLIGLATLSMIAIAPPASAQNAGQIARVRGGAGCPGCNLFQGDFSGADISGRDLSGARLRQADLSVAVMTRTRFARADLRDVEAYGGVFSGSSFAGADLTNASFVGAHLDGANFAGATLDGVNFAGASLERASGLSQNRLNQACGDEATRLPAGLRLPRC